MDEVVKLLRVESSGYEPGEIAGDVLDVMAYLTSLLQKRVVRWLNGVGHIGISSATVTPEEYERQMTNTLYRAKTFLEAVTECDTLPLPHQNIRVCPPSKLLLLFPSYTMILIDSS